MLPTYSVNDTEQSRDEGDLFLSVFDRICPDADHTTTCRELTRVLPTYSVNDTEQSRDEGDLFLGVFKGICNPG